MTSSPISSVPPAPEADTRVEAICAKHGAYSARVHESPFGGRPIITGCPKCADDRRVDEERTRQHQAQRDRELKVEALLQAAAIPARFQNATIAEYVADSTAQKRVKAACQKYVDGFEAARERGPSIVMCGRPGTGKTHLACAIAETLIEKHCITAHFYTVLGAIRTIKDTYRSTSERTETEAIDALIGEDLLILDEVGVQVGSEHEKMLVFEVINERYQECRPTILISNLSAPELTDYLGDRVMDRFRECGGVLAFEWQSHRGKRAA